MAKVRRLRRARSGDRVLLNQGNKVPHAAHCRGSFKVHCRHTQTHTRLSVDAGGGGGEESHTIKKHTEELWDVSLGRDCLNFRQASQYFCTF